MADDNITVSFLVVSDLFDNYTILYNSFTESTSVYCNECEIWVADWSGDKLSNHTKAQLYEEIIDKHDEQVRGTIVEIGNNEANFLQ